MIKSAEIRNFRCFAHARLDDCRTINVITGNNAGGKTALLEALFLSLGASPEVVLRFRNWRGGTTLISGNAQEIDRQVWRDIFHRFDFENSIHVEIKGEKQDRDKAGQTRYVKVRYKEEQDFIVSVGADGKVPFKSPIIFSYKRPKTPERNVTATLTEGQYAFRGADPQGLSGAFFASGYPFSHQENLDRFSRLSREHNEQKLVDAISREFSFIRGLAILNSGGQPSLHVDTPWFPEKVPLSTISSGVSKLIYLLVAIIAMPDSVLLIDEIENGFYYERFPSMWDTIHRLAKDNNVQIFASTHSWECLDGLKTACGKNPEDISFIRSTVSLGSGRLEQFHGTTILPAMESGEIR
jgi:predicted ATPase